MRYWGLDEAQNLAAAFYDLAEKEPEKLVYAQAQFDGQFESKHERRWVETQAKDVKERINKVAQYLKSTGVKKGTKVAIISTSRPEWMEADLAILACGGISISVYQTLPEREIAYILYDSGAEIVFAENEEQVKKVLKIGEQEWNIPATEDRPESKSRITIKKVISFENTMSSEIVTVYRQLVNGPAAPIPADLDKITRADLASFVYTSGTTGPPKGVVQTHGNHLANIRQAAESGLYVGTSTIMMFLPLAHSFAKLMGYIGFVTPASLKFIAIVDNKTSRMEPVSVTRDIREGSAKIVPIVPRLLEKMKDGILRQANAAGLKGTILTNAVRSAEELYEKGAHASFKTKMLFFLTAGIRTKIRHKLFGPHFMYCVVGGAKLPVPVAKFFDAIGIELLEGYGLTETCVATNVNPVGRKKIGSVGPLLSKDIELKILEDSELCYRGPNISLGYNNRKTATESSWDQDGWFHTGDLGSLDKDSYLTITGRKKEIIVGSTGKKVAPNDIEDKVKGCPYVSQIVMVGEGRAYCTALITLNEESVRDWGRSLNKDLSQKLSEDPEVKTLIWAFVQEINEKLANFEQIKQIAILPGDFTVDNLLLTPTFKIKRKLVEERFKDVVDGLY